MAYKLQSWGRDKYGGSVSIKANTQAELEIEAQKQGVILTPTYVPSKPPVIPTFPKLPAIIPMDTGQIKEPEKELMNTGVPLYDPYEEGGFGAPTGEGATPWETQRQADKRAEQERLRKEQQQKDSYNAFQMQPKTSLSVATMSDTETQKTQSKLDKLTSSYLTDTSKTADNAWLSQESKTIKIKKEQDTYTKEIKAELEKLIAYRPDTINKFQPQLEAMAKAGIKMADIEKTIKGLTTGTLEQLKPQLESYYERYMKPEVMAEYGKELVPYAKIAQERIAQLEVLPKQQKDLFYGTPEKKGALEQLKAEAEERKRIANQQLISDQTTLQQSNDLNKATLDADLTSQNIDIDLKVQRAKDYLTGSLAKMGALTTTGSAIVQINDLNAKYAEIKANVKTKYSQMINQNTIRYDELSRNLIIKKDTDIANINKTVGKTQREKDEAILKLKEKANDKIDNLSFKLLDKFIETNRQALAESKKQSAEFVKNYFNVASSGTQQQLLAQVMPKILNFQKEEMALKAIKENLTIALKQKQLEKPYFKTGIGTRKGTTTGKGKGTGKEDIETYAQDVIDGNISLSSVSDKIQTSVSKRVKELGGVKPKLTKEQKLIQNKKNFIANQKAGVPFEQAFNTYGHVLSANWMKERYGITKETKPLQVEISNQEVVQKALSKGITQDLINAAKAAGMDLNDLMK